MESKFLEIRDFCTTIPVIAIKTLGDDKNEIDFFKHGGWNNHSIILININGGVDCSNDPFYWRLKHDSRTLFQSHIYLQKNYDNLKNFDVIDIEYILEEQPIKKIGEILKNV